jgi:uncharacterized protein YciW
MIAANYVDHIVGVREKCSVLRAELEKSEKAAARLEELRDKRPENNGRLHSIII